MSQDLGDDDDRDSRRVAGRWYATSFDVGHNAFEFTVDCGRDSGNEEDVMTVVFRVIASPHNARELFRHLGTSLLRYADRFGPIDDADARPDREEQ